MILYQELKYTFENRIRTSPILHMFAEILKDKDIANKAAQRGIWTLYGHSKPDKKCSLFAPVPMIG